MSNKRDKYIDLDKRLNKLMQQFGDDYPNEYDVSISGSVLYGGWRVQREGFDGLKFKPSDKQMNELAVKGQTIVKKSDLIHQKEYDG